MKLTVHRKYFGVPFTSLENASFFVYEGNLYFKIKSVNSDHTIGKHMAVSLSDKLECLQEFDWATKCVPVEIEVVAREI
jgi:hypothetical protein